MSFRPILALCLAVVACGQVNYNHTVAGRFVFVPNPRARALPA